jgi:small subunit ribosomal protein S1
MHDDLRDQNEQYEEPKQDEESFADLFESYQSGMSDNLKVGDRITGKIIAIDESNIFLNTGTKIDGVAVREELVDKNGDLPYQIGDELDLYVVELNENEIKLSKAIAGVGGFNILQDAFRAGIPVEGRVKGLIKGGFQVEVLHRRAFCPLSQMDARYVEKPDEYVGQTFQFLVKRLEEKGRNIVLSRREILEKEQKQNQKEFLEHLTPDAVVPGRVTRLMPYGAFVELVPGLEGMVHISELSWSRIQKPQEAVNSGETVHVKVLKVEPGKKEGEKKISLSIKQVSQDPWNQVASTVHTADRLQGKVTRCMGFGVFVEILPGIEGLVHISEMSYTRRVVNPQEIVNPGDMIPVVVKEVDAANRRISLSMKDAEGDPWSTIHDKFAIGQAVVGKIEKKEKFGFFVNLEPGITGLIPKSGLKGPTGAEAFDKMKEGDAVNVIINEIHPDTRRISLGLAEARSEEDWKAFTGEADRSLGSLGEQLRRAIEGKEK